MFAWQAMVRKWLERSVVSDPSEPPWLRRAERIVYAFLFACITSGLFLVYYAAFGGNVLNAMVGAAIVIGGSGAALMMLTLVRTGRLAVRNTESLEAIGHRVDAIEDMLQVALSVPPQEDGKTAEVNLSDIGKGDPGPLVAATLPSDGFPRLARQDEPDGETGSARPRGEARDPLDLWQTAFERGDIRACRRILAEAGDRIEPDRRLAMSEAMEAFLAGRKETLRDEFSSRVRAGHFEEALAIGRQIADMFPGSDLAAEFERIEPHLRARLKRVANGE